MRKNGKYFYCIICTKKFYRKQYSIRKGHTRFCSSKCYGKWLKINNIGRKNPNWEERIKKKCLICHKLILVLPCNKNRTKFCSRKCKGKWKSLHETGSNNYNWRGNYKTVKCKSCKKIIRIAQNAYNKKQRYHFCSRKCVYAYYRGKNHPKWNSRIFKCAQCGELIIRPKCGSKTKLKFCSKSCHGLYLIKHSRTKDTDIEKIIESWLIKNLVKFEKQKVIKKLTIVDFFIRPNICLYVDGDYWHSSKDRIYRDRRINRLLRIRGYKVIRIRGSKIKKGKRPNKVLQNNL